MNTVLAALDVSAAAHPVLQTALGLGELTGAEVRAVHVGNAASTPQLLAAHSDVAFEILGGPTGPALLGALAEPNVIAVVLGARATPGGHRPAGRTALHVAQHADKPVVIVPPDAAVDSLAHIRRLLVPLDGTDSSSQTIIEDLYPLLVAEVEMVVLHVFTEATLPRMLNHWHRDMELLGKEFLARYFPYGDRIELRSGAVANCIEDLCREAAIDLVVLSWSQELDVDHAPVIHELLCRSALPVLLLPAATTAPQTPPTARKPD